MSTTNPSQVVQTQTGFAPDVAPYAETLLGQAQNQITNNPNYTSYGQWAQGQGIDPNQVAGFTGLQNQAFGTAQGLNTNPYSMQAAQGTQGLLANNNFDSQTAQNMMSPYMQNVVQTQQNEAQRQANIQTTANDSQATGAGAFGGSRQSVMDSENQRNLATTQANIQATGLQNAYSSAQNQFNTQQQTGLAGLSNLGSMGQNIYGQGISNLNMQDQLGTQQQSQAQNMINTNVNNYTNAMNYPYMQMGFMNDVVRGLPTSTQGSTVYNAAPSTVSQAAGLGTAAAGLLGAGTSSSTASTAASTLAKGGVARSKTKAGGLPALLVHSMG